MAAAQGNGSGANVLTALNRLVGTKFNMVKGYKSVSESGLAMERGEVQGISSTSWEYRRQQRLDQAKGYRLSLHHRLETQPENSRHADDQRACQQQGGSRRAALDRERGGYRTRDPDAAKCTGERMEALRDAFATMLRDPDFIRDAERRSLEIEPMAGRGCNNSSCTPWT